MKIYINLLGGYIVMFGALVSYIAETLEDAVCYCKVRGYAIEYMYEIYPLY